jgi:hypothetical protein
MSRAYIRGPVLHGCMLGGLVLFVCGMSGLADAPVMPARSVAAVGSTTTMRFALLNEGPAEACTAKCRPLISATGMITADTPRQFNAFIRDNGVPASKGAVPAATVVLESDGGSVLGALELGRAIRRLGFATMVGRVVERRGKSGARYAEVVARADCQSMCTFVLLGGVQREVPLDARVLVHQIWLGDRRDDAVAANYTAEDLMVVQRDIGSIMQYTVEMGGDVELIALSLKAPPWEPMRALTREELRRTHLDLANSGEAAAAASAVQTAAGPAPVDDDAERPADAHGWITVTRDGQTALARSHPLTHDGERIGSFDLYLACGATPQTFTLTYRETRTGSAEGSLPHGLTQVAVMIEDHIQPLRIGSSERRARRGQLESLANAVLPAQLVHVLAGDSPASLTLETESNGSPRTVTRVGNAGFGRNFPELEKTCGQPQPQLQHGRGDARAQN